MALTFQLDASLQPYNSMAVQAKAKALVCISSLRELNEALDYARTNKLKVLMLGEGSNTLFENDYAGLVVLNRLKGIKLIEQSSESVVVQVSAGENWHDFVSYCMEQGWFGLENLALIPGLVGAAPIQNIGAYGVEVKDSLVSVDYLDIVNAEQTTLANAECGFGYRESCFKNTLAGKVVITAVTFKLSKIPDVNISYPVLASKFDMTPSPREVFNAVVAIRQDKLPLPSVIPNTGSFFKNPVVSADQYNKLKKQYVDLVAYPVPEGFKLAAGWLIEKAGWKQKKYNGVGVHDMQALVIVNPEKKSGKDVVDFARKIQQDVASKFCVLLEIEPRVY